MTTLAPRHDHLMKSETQVFDNLFGDLSVDVLNVDTINSFSGGPISVQSDVSVNTVYAYNVSAEYVNPRIQRIVKQESGTMTTPLFAGTQILEITGFDYTKYNYFEVMVQFEGSFTQVAMDFSFDGTTFPANLCNTVANRQDVATNVYTWTQTTIAPAQDTVYLIPPQVLQSTSMTLNLKLVPSLFSQNISFKNTFISQAQGLTTIEGMSQNVVNTQSLQRLRLTCVGGIPANPYRYIILGYPSTPV